jgi:NAD(P)-dependent dehydrogenase (short-subunit alcohol dehydrogenase family)
MHKFGKLDFDSFKGWKKYNANASYAQSKLAMQMNAMELAERLRERNIAVNTLHPGAVSTGILDGYSPLQQFILRLFFTTPEKGARTSMHVVALEGSDRPTGTYFSGSKPAKPGKQIANQALRKKIWNLSCEYCGLTPAL